MTAVSPASNTPFPAASTRRNSDGVAEDVSEHAVVVAVLVEAGPGHHVAPRRGGSDGRPLLREHGVRVDAELAADPRARRVEALAEHSLEVAVLVEVIPDDQEVAVRIERRRGRTVEPVRVSC